MLTSTRNQGSGTLLSLQDRPALECPGKRADDACRPLPSSGWAAESRVTLTSHTESFLQPGRAPRPLVTHSLPSSAPPGSPVHPTPRAHRTLQRLLARAPALLPTQLALPPAQAVGRHTDTTASGTGRDPPAPVEAIAPAPGTRPPSLTCDNMTAWRQILPAPQPHFREPRQHSCSRVRCETDAGWAPQAKKPTYRANRKPLAGNTSFAVRLVGGSNSLDRKSGRRVRVTEGRATYWEGRGKRGPSADLRSRRRGGACGRGRAAEALSGARQRWAGQAWPGQGLHL